MSFFHVVRSSAVSFVTKKSLVPWRVAAGYASVSHAGGDSVVARCTSMLKEHLKDPIHILVTSSNDDPNGSHVIFIVSSVSLPPI
jgi:hypothetical protein